MIQYLFNEIEGHDYFRGKEDNLIKEISRLTKNELINSDDALKILLSAKHRIKEIKFEEYYQEDKGEIDIDISRDPRFAAYDSNSWNPVYRKGRQIDIHLPYSCDNILFKIEPSSSLLSKPKANISKELIFTFNFISGVDNAEELKRHINEEISLTKKYSDWLNQDIQLFNSRIETIIETNLDARRLKLSQDDKILSILDIPKKEPGDSIGFIKPNKKIKLRILQETDSHIDPALQLETYNEIIKLIDSLGVNLERSSERLRDLDEESLRDAFLMALNSVYQGMTSGEAFNKTGKTDICIKYKDTNLFIAECKIWGGEEQFKEGLEQLFSYLTWRDTKTSYILFSRNKDITLVIKKAKEILEQDERYVKVISENTESSITYKFKNKATSKELFVNLHIFHLG